MTKEFDDVFDLESGDYASKGVDFGRLHLSLDSAADYSNLQVLL